MWEIRTIDHGLAPFPWLVPDTLQALFLRLHRRPHDWLTALLALSFANNFGSVARGRTRERNMPSGSLPSPAVTSRFAGHGPHQPCAASFGLCM